MLCPECLEDITSKILETRNMVNGAVPFSVLRTPFYHQVFSAIRNREMVIGHVHTRMAESGRFQSLMERMLVTIHSNSVSLNENNYGLMKYYHDKEENIEISKDEFNSITQCYKDVDKATPSWIEIKP